MKILIVEDDLYSRKFLHDLLTFENYECQVAKNGEEGLKLHDEFHPDIVISDIQMPKMNGLDLLEAIRKRRSDTIVIMTTAFGSEEFAIKALQLGANNYLKKPILDKDLLPLLRKYEQVINNNDTHIFDTGKVIFKYLKLEFETRIESISRIVERIICELDGQFDDTEKINIELGLLELVTNAVEHGNLEIDYDEKNKALNADKLNKLYEERLQNPLISQRKIFVDYEYDGFSCQWTIRDEGKGFDWQSIPNPTIDGNLLGLNGRGIFITRFLFDEIEYIGNGNTVRIKKNCMS